MLFFAHAPRTPACCNVGVWWWAAVLVPSATIAACTRDLQTGTITTGTVTSGGASAKLLADGGNLPDAGWLPDGAPRIARGPAGQDGAGSGFGPLDGGGGVAVKDGGGTGTCQVVAVVEVKEGEQVIPQTVLHLLSAKSKPSCGSALVSYQWTVKQPGCMTQPLLPSAAAPAPTLLANAPGEYQFCLSVTDKSGQKSAPACVTVLVVPAVQLELALSWCAPGVAPADAVADLDLHVAEPHTIPNFVYDLDAGFESYSHDCYYWNKTPEIADPNSLADNPVLVLDNLVGPGPELVNVAAPAGTASNPAYLSVGVRYWSGEKKPDVVARVDIYIAGQPVVQVTNAKLQWHSSWFVGLLPWPNTANGGTQPALKFCYPQGGPSCNSGCGVSFSSAVGDFCIDKFGAMTWGFDKP